MIKTILAICILLLLVGVYFIAPHALIFAFWGLIFLTGIGFIIAALMKKTSN